MQTTKIFAVIISLLVIAGSVYFVVHNHEQKNNPAVARRAEAPMPVSFVSAKSKDVTGVIGANGVVIPINTVQLTQLYSQKVSGVVTEVLADIGDIVETGQILMQFDFRKAALELDVAEAKNNEAVTELESATQELAQLKSLNEDGMEKIALEYANSSVEHAKINLELAQKDLQRLNKIRSQQLISESEVEQAMLMVSKAKENHLEMIDKNFQTQRKLHLDLNLAKMNEAKAKTAIITARQNLLSAQLDNENMTVRAPVKGIILDRHLSIGEIPTSEKKLYTIGQLDQVLITANFSEEHLADVYLGQLATATFSAYPNEILEGKVVKIDPVTDANTKSFMVYVNIPNPKMFLKPGLSSFVRLQIDKKALMVPDVSLINPTGKDTEAAFIVGEDKTVKLVQVKTGISSHGFTEIVEGLTSEDTVVAVGQYYLQNGDHVRNVEE